MSARFFRSVLLLAFSVGVLQGPVFADSSPRVPAPAINPTLAQKHGKETAVFAGGCFWGMQAVFAHVKGVLSTDTGYSGGKASTATYTQVSSESTNHAESIKVVFDPARITYGTLLHVFFSVINPTELNRQGPDVGRSYRSVIFFANPDQKRVAEAYIAQLNKAKVFSQPIVTQVQPLNGFYRAESYHQDYARNHPDNPYILICDRPKVATLKQDFPDLYGPYTDKR